MTVAYLQPRGQTIYSSISVSSGSSLAGSCLSYAIVRGHIKEGTKTGRTMLSDVRMVITLGGKVTRRLCRGGHLRHVCHLFLDASNY